MPSSINFSKTEKEKDAFISALIEEGWEVRVISTLEHGVKVSCAKENDINIFVIYKNKENKYTKIVIEKSSETFKNLLEKLTNSLPANQKIEDKKNPQAVKKYPLRSIKDIPSFKMHIGTDETGKGDYFGPLVVAGVVLDEESEKKISSLGVSDSKKHNNNSNIKLMNQLLSILTEKQYSVRIISPSEYNKMFNDIGNTNNILAIAHTSVIRDLLIKNPECKNVVVDQFANESLLEFYLSNEIKKQKIKLLQTPKGERDIAVAAASIIARGTLINEFKKMSIDTGIDIPFGAGKNVDNAAKKLLNNILMEQMSKYIKINFANTKKIKG